MSRYVLVGGYSGYVFADSVEFNGGDFQGTATEFARMVDGFYGDNHFAYREERYPDNRMGYHVYRPDPDFPAVHNDVDPDTFSALERSSAPPSFIVISGLLD